MEEENQVERKRSLLLDVNPHLLCVLCAGYYIDPTTIVECLHSCEYLFFYYLLTTQSIILYTANM